MPKEFDPEFLRIPSTKASLVIEEDVGEGGEEEEVPEYLEDMREEATMDLTTEEAISPSQVTVLTLFCFLFQCITNMRIYSAIVLP